MTLAPKNYWLIKYCLILISALFWWGKPPPYIAFFEINDKTDISRF